MALIQFIKDVLEAEKKGGNINDIKIKKAEAKETASASPAIQQIKR